MSSPLPVRNGVNATRVRLPGDGPWATALDYLLDRWGHVDPDGIRARFDGGEVAAADGTRLTATTPLSAHTFIWYYRDLPTETPIPFDVDVLHEDDHLLVADKPHFLPTTPGGGYVSESALVRLRVRTGIDDLTPVHRLDRMTAGVVLFAKDPATRGRYQVLFERRQVRKEYEALAGVRDDLDLPVTVRSRIEKSPTYLLAREVPGPPNAETVVELAEVLEDRSDPAAERVGRYRLRPRTGKTHQLRVHMASLGLGIRGDRYYPVLQDEAPDDHARPLGLLARSVAFTDPITGREVTFSSRRSLAP
ncbi:pseudouridylate synthase [Tersicoccus solisilvae]|uniref:RNA pseudouridylate synthase n=1 Tax=Tersicoccus solisilvae TaxID=1882339 RepID=A0ABQ1P6F2_9MICC|nr:pseudouridine synthase [Tersicoccus solisilvae]GGC90235.1 pseudouridylate synthase [Tersicoccus solisilvae]